MAEREWPKSLVDVVGQQVYEHRTARDWSRRELSEQLQAIGAPMEEPVIVNLERRRRGTLSVAELFALGRVLDVPPLTLLFPVGRVEEMEVLKGEVMSPWEALRWAEHGVDTVKTRFGPQNRVLHMFSEHDRVMELWRQVTRVLQDVDDQLATTEAQDPHRAGLERHRKTAAQEREDCVDRLRLWRADMLEQGLIPPRLPVELRFIEAEEREKAGNTDV